MGGWVLKKRTMTILAAAATAAAAADVDVDADIVVALTAPKCAIMVCNVAWRVVAVWICNIVS